MVKIVEPPIGIMSNPDADIKDQDWSKNSKELQLLKDYFNPQVGDGIRRLKISA